MKTDFVDNFGIEIQFPEAEMLQTHLEALFTDDKN